MRGRYDSVCFTESFTARDRVVRGVISLAGYQAIALKIVGATQLALLSWRYPPATIPQTDLAALAVILVDGCRGAIRFRPGSAPVLPRFRLVSSSLDDHRWQSAGAVAENLAVP